MGRGQRAFTYPYGWGNAPLAVLFKDKGLQGTKIIFAKSAADCSSCSSAPGWRSVWRRHGAGPDLWDVDAGTPLLS